MKRIFPVFVLLGAVVFSQIANATAVTLDFEEVDDFTIFYGSFATQGYEFGVESSTIVVRPFGGDMHLSTTAPGDGYAKLTLSNQNGFYFFIVEFRSRSLARF